LDAGAADTEQMRDEARLSRIASDVISVHAIVGRDVHNGGNREAGARTLHHNADALEQRVAWTFAFFVAVSSRLLFAHHPDDARAKAHAATHDEWDHAPCHPTHVERASTKASQENGEEDRGKLVFALSAANGGGVNDARRIELGWSRPTVLTLTHIIAVAGPKLSTFAMLATGAGCRAIARNF